MFPSFKVFERTIGMYSVAAIVGLLIAAVFFFLRVKKKNVRIEDVILMTLTIVAGLLVGGHLLYGLTQISNIVSLIKGAEDLTFVEFVQKLAGYFGGAVFYGGLFGSFAAGAIYLKHSKLAPETKTYVVDTYACAVPLFHTFGRIGCFLGGCCYGIESEFGFIAHGNTVVPELNDVRRFPVALFEAGCNLILFFVLWYVSNRAKKQGRTVYYYGLAYPVIRFTLEFFRGDEIRGKLFGLSTSQWISILFFAFSAAMLIYLHSKDKKPMTNANE